MNVESMRPRRIPDVSCLEQVHANIFDEADSSSQSGGPTYERRGRAEVMLGGLLLGPWGGFRASASFRESAVHRHI